MYFCMYLIFKFHPKMFGVVESNALFWCLLLMANISNTKASALPVDSRDLFH